MSTFVAVLILAVLLILRAGYGDALVSRGTMSSCVPYYLNPPHRVVMLGDRLSWDSADYKIFEALESLTTVEDAVFVQVDEVDEDLLALQLRNFDPDTVLVSVRTRAFENLPWTVLQIVRTQCRRRHEIVVLVFHLHAHAIPPSDRAFASIRRAGHVVDSYESRAMGRWHDPRTSLEVLQLHVDELGPLDADDLLAGRLSLEWFGQTVPVRMCSAMSCAHIPCAGSSALHEIIVFVGAANCSALSGDELKRDEDAAHLQRAEAEVGCREAMHITSKYGASSVLVMQPSNASAVSAQLARAYGGGRGPGGLTHAVARQIAGAQGEDEMVVTRDLLMSAKVLVIVEAGDGEGSFSPMQHAAEAMALGGPAVLISEAVVGDAGTAAFDLNLITNGTNALVYRKGDLAGLGHLLHHMLTSEQVQDEESGDWEGRMGASASKGRPWRCALRERACQDACERHLAEHKVAAAIGAAHARRRAAVEEEGEEELAGDAVSCTGGEDEQVLGLGGSQLNLGDLLPHDKIDFDATIVDVSYLSEKERSVAAPVMPPEVVGSVRYLGLLGWYC